MHIIGFLLWLSYFKKWNILWNHVCLENSGHITTLLHSCNKQLKGPQALWFSPISQLISPLSHSQQNLTPLRQRRRKVLQHPEWCSREPAARQGRARHPRRASWEGVLAAVSVREVCVAWRCHPPRDDTQGRLHPAPPFSTSALRLHAITYTVLLTVLFHFDMLLHIPWHKALPLHTA